MHIAFRKALANGVVSFTSTPDWDQLKYQLSRLDTHDTDDWDAHFAWENFRSGYIIKDSTGLWRYVSLERDDFNDAEIFDGRIIDLFEIDPIFD